MGFFKEFRDFAVKGNVLQLAIGVIIGASFGKIVSSLVDDILMPPVGYLIGGINFTDIKINLSNIITGITGAGPAEKPVTINIGNFIQVSINFLIIAFTIFLIVKIINKLERHEEEKKGPPEPTKEESLLMEIRDLLKKTNENKG